MNEKIVSDLREAARFEDEYPVTAELHIEAADEIERLRAELDAERERNEDLTTVYMFAFEKGKDAMRAELAAERELLREANKVLNQNSKNYELIARIDAALNKGGEDE